MEERGESSSESEQQSVGDFIIESVDRSSDNESLESLDPPYMTTRIGQGRNNLPRMAQREETDEAAAAEADDSEVDIFLRRLISPHGLQPLAPAYLRYSPPSSFHRPTNLSSTLQALNRSAQQSEEIMPRFTSCTSHSHMRSSVCLLR